MNKVYLWQQAQWAHLNALRLRGQFPHAVLLHGAKDLGKRAFAMALAGRLLCGREVCQGDKGCQSCYLMSVGHHPDFCLVEPVDGSKVIKVDQIRSLVSTLSQTSQRGGMQVVVLCLAESMHVAAANALLKTLEEPHAGVVFLLVSDQPASLPATIRSRCQAVNFVAPDVSVGVEWLKVQGLEGPEAFLALAENVPLYALRLSDVAQREMYEKVMSCLVGTRLSEVSPLQAAEVLLNVSLVYVFDVLWSVMMDIVRLKFGQSRLRHVGYAEGLSQISSQVRMWGVFGFVDELLEFKKKVVSGVALNQQLLLEDLLIKWRG